jgi:hypothetical protein
MIEQTTEVQELSLEKVIQTKLVQNNVTDQVLTALKDRYSGLKLKELDDKESYLEIKAAVKDCAKVRNLAVKVCKEGREDAVRIQKLWVAKEKEVVARVAEVETPLDEEIAKFDAEVERKINEEKQRKEEEFINRQSTLTKMGAVYVGGNFVLGDVSFELELVKGSSEDVWEEAVVPKYREEYEKIQAVKIAEERKKAEEEAEMRRKQEEFQRQQEEFQKQQAEFQRQKEEADKKAKAEMDSMIRNRCIQLESLGMKFYFQHDAYLFEDVNVDNKTEISLLGSDEWDALVEKIKPIIEERKVAAQKQEEEKRAAEIEAAKVEAAKKERERLEEAARQAEIRRQQEEARKAEELAQASEKDKYSALIAEISAIKLPEMRSSQYRTKVAAIRKKIDEILAL